MEPAPEEVDTPQAQCPDVIVIFAVSTTDITSDSGIVQISARCNDNVFTKHILADEDVSTNSERVNGFAIRRVANERRLFYCGVAVETVPPHEGLNSFLDFLNDLLSNSGKVVLAAHYTFHGYTMIRQIERYGLLRTFESRVSGFIDTVDVLKSKLEERAQNHESFALDQLARAYLGENSVPEILVRNAQKNVEILVSLINNRQCSDEEMMEFAKELTQFINLMPEQVEARIEGLRAISDAVSYIIWKKIAKAGISIDTLRQRYQEGAVDGVTMLLEGVISGTPGNPQIIINVITDELHAMNEADNQNLQPA